MDFVCRHADSCMTSLGLHRTGFAILNVSMVCLPKFIVNCKQFNARNGLVNNYAANDPNFEFEMISSEIGMAIKQGMETIAMVNILKTVLCRDRHWMCPEKDLDACWIFRNNRKIWETCYPGILSTHVVT